MTDLSDRLKKCFSAVFPDLPLECIQDASVETVLSWDSVAAVTLNAVVEEEFDIEIEADDIVDLTSFAVFLDFLKKKMR
jgi:acyl carrier protein